MVSASPPCPHGPLSFATWGSDQIVLRPGSETHVNVIAGNRGHGPDTLAVVDENFLDLERDVVLEEGHGPSAMTVEPVGADPLGRLAFDVVEQCRAVVERGEPTDKSRRAATVVAALSAAALAAADGDGVPRLREEELRAHLPLFRKSRRGVVLRRAARREGREVRRDGAAKVVVLEVPPYAVAMVVP